MANSIEHLEARLAQAGPGAERADALNALADALFRTDSPRALSLYEEGYAHACDPERGLPLAQADSLLGMGRVRIALGVHDLALVQTSEALAIYRRAGALARQQVALNQLGALYSVLGDYAASLDYRLKGLALARECGDRAAEANMALGIGIVYSEMGRPAEALGFYEQALVTCRELGNRQLEGRVLNSCCVDCTNLGEIERALACGRRSAELFEQTGDRYGQGVALGSIGEAYVAAGRYAEALESLGRSLEQLRTRSPDLSSAEAVAISFQIGLAQLRSGDTEGARGQLEAALARAELSGLGAIASQCHEQLAALCEQRGDLGAALAHVRQFHALREQSFNAASDQKLRNMEVLHRTRQALEEAARQKQLREDDRRYFEQLAQLQRELFNTATHDLKNPLTTIDLGIRLLEQVLPADEGVVGEVLTAMRSGIARMQGLISGFLDLARLETGRALAIGPVIPAQILAAAVRDQRLAAEQKQLALSLRAELDDVIMECDADLVRRAVDNLIGNAIKYTPPGGAVSVAASCAAGAVQITVADTGPGIPAADQPRLFERFYRVRSPQHAAQEGSGLGLTIVKSIAEQHGGTVWVESGPGQGSAFHMRLPLSQAQAISIGQGS